MHVRAQSAARSGPLPSRHANSRMFRMSRVSLKPLAFALIATFAANAQAAPTGDVATRVKALNELLAEQWQWALKEAPEFATILGDYRYNDRFSDITLAHAQ